MGFLLAYQLENWPDTEQAVWSLRGTAISNIVIGEMEAAQEAADRLLTEFSAYDDAGVMSQAVFEVADAYYWYVHYPPADDTMVVATGQEVSLSAKQGVDIDCMIIEGGGREEVYDYVKPYWSDDTGRPAGDVFIPRYSTGTTWTAPDTPGVVEVTATWYNPWNNFYFDDDNIVASPTVSREITVVEVEVEITLPYKDPFWSPGGNEFVFDSSGSGICNVLAAGTTGVSSLDDDLEWTLDGISGSTLTSTPSPAEGSNVTFTYTGLPSSNSEFGEKILTLDYPPNGQSDTQEVEIFFARDAYNHGGEGNGTIRNWFYYWKEGGVVPDMAYFEYLDAPTRANAGGFLGNYAPEDLPRELELTNWFYQTTINTGADGICNTEVCIESPDKQDAQVIDKGKGEPHAIAINAGNDGILQTTPSGDDQPVGSTITTGLNGICETEPAAGSDDEYIYYGDIQMKKDNGKPYTTCITSGADNFMHSASLHPLFPTLDPNDVWDTTGAQQISYHALYSGIDACAVACTHELKHMEIHELPGEDNDLGVGDGVPDYFELLSEYHFDPDSPDTYGMSFYDDNYIYGGDDEILALMAEYLYGPVYPDIDWSDTNGKQWQKY